VRVRPARDVDEQIEVAGRTNTSPRAIESTRARSVLTNPASTIMEAASSLVEINRSIKQA
jgi:hypothetical protein